MYDFDEKKDDFYEVYAPHYYQEIINSLDKNSISDYVGRLSSVDWDTQLMTVVNATHAKTNDEWLTHIGKFIIESIMQVIKDDTDMVTEKAYRDGSRANTKNNHPASSFIKNLTIDDIQKKYESLMTPQMQSFEKGSISFNIVTLDDFQDICVTVLDDDFCAKLAKIVQLYDEIQFNSEYHLLEKKLLTPFKMAGSLFVDGFANVVYHETLQEKQENSKPHKLHL